MFSASVGTALLSSWSVLVVGGWWLVGSMFGYVCVDVLYVLIWYILLIVCRMLV
ncbi:hypothetical protein DFH29DRAFT_921290 [Suillus ampliporus]|nr:hypothetical protein DFH29DRAFT_921290 [Suillus ampliporus]